MLQTCRKAWPSITKAGRAIVSTGTLAAGLVAGGGLLGSQTASAESIRHGQYIDNVFTS